MEKVGQPYYSPETALPVSFGKPVLGWASVQFQMVMVLVLGPGAAYEARVGLVGSTLMGRSQLKVSTGTCSGPVQVAGSGCSTGGRRTNPGSRDVTNSKCNRHFSDTMAVQKPGVQLRGIGREKLVLVVCKQDSWWRA